MNKIILGLLLFFSLASVGQTYTPNIDGVTLNSPISPAQGVPTDSRSMYHDRSFNTWRPYISTTEVLSWLNLSKYREGMFDIYVNVGGTLSSGKITGGVNYVYFFKNGTSNSDLVLKGNITSVNGQTGVVSVKNADSLKSLPLDTTANTNGYVITFDKPAKKFYLSPKGTAPSYSPGTGIDITSGVISALNTTALWNANSLRGRNISSAAPTVGQVIAWDGLAYSPQDMQAFNQIIYDNDTLYFISGADTLKTFFQVDVPGDNWGFQTAAANAPIYGNGRDDNPLYADTISSTGLATKSDKAQLEAQIAAIVPGGGVTTRLKNPLIGDTLSVKINDSTYRIKSLRNGANVSFSITDTTVTINSTPGTAEVNNNDSTLTTTGNMTVPVEAIVDYILVKPVANLTAFKVGTVGDDDAFITATPVMATGDFQMLIAPFYLTTSTAIYFSGITSSTDIQIIFKPIHR